MLNYSFWHKQCKQHTHPVQKKRGTASITFFTIDETEKLAYVLLGINHMNQLCHCHGYIYKNETAAQAASRKGYEESKGIFGSQLSLFAHIINPETQFVCPGDNNPAYGVYVGPTTSEERSALELKYLSLPAYSTCMLENTRIKFVEMKGLRSACLKFEDYVRQKMKETHQVDFEFSKVALSVVSKGDVYVGNDALSVPDFPVGTCLRGFAHPWFFCCSSFWNDPKIAALVNDCTPLHTPLKQIGGKLVIRLARMLHVEVCSLCQQPGHATELCWERSPVLAVVSPDGAFVVNEHVRLRIYGTLCHIIPGSEVYYRVVKGREEFLALVTN
jgi:hypothetical protein